MVTTGGYKNFWIKALSSDTGHLIVD